MEPDRSTRRPRRLPRLAPVAVALLVLLTGCANEASAPAPSTRAAAPATAGWQRISASPLSARWGSVAAWVGGRFVVVGGATDHPCPPNAGCVIEPEPPQRDGAAYDPATDRWTAIAAAPIPVAQGRQAVVGDDLYLATWDVERPDVEHVLRYDLRQDRWSELPTPPGGGGAFVAAGDRLVAISASADGRGAADAVLDPDTSTWSALPRDPLGAGSSRAATWVDGRLLLVSRPEGEKEATPVRVAELDGALQRWTARPSLPTVGLGPTAVDGLVVFPLLGTTNIDRDFPYGGVYDPRTERFSALPDVGRPRADGPQIRGAVGDSVVVQGVRFSPRTGATTPLPALPIPTPLQPAVANGDASVLLFGGSTRDARTNSAAGYLLRFE